MTLRYVRELYPSVITWFSKKLKAQHRGADISVFDTSKTYLRRFLRNEDLDKHFPDYLTYEIQVDITAVIKRTGKVELAFIECKINDLTLRDISQLLGYSRV